MRDEKSRNAYKRMWRNKRNLDRHYERLNRVRKDIDRSIQLYLDAREDHLEMS